MGINFVKLAYIVGYKQAQEDNVPLFDPKTGKPLPGFDEGMAYQSSAASPLVPAGVAAGSGYLAYRGLRRNPIPGLESRLQEAAGNLTRLTASGANIRKVNAAAKQFSRAQKTLNFAKRHKTLYRIGRASPWALAAGLAASAVAAGMS